MQKNKEKYLHQNVNRNQNGVIMTEANKLKWLKWLNNATPEQLKELDIEINKLRV